MIDPSVSSDSANSVVLMVSIDPAEKIDFVHLKDVGGWIESDLGGSA